jgi:hypothetical protein
MARPKIDSYRFGEIVIDGQRYDKDVIIFPDGVMPNWWRQSGHELRIPDLADVLQASATTLVIGTGAHGRMQVPRKTLAHLEEHGVEAIAKNTDQACQLYNQMRGEKPVIAALHLTC